MTSKTNATSPPFQPQQRRMILHKQMSWSPDTEREDAWLRREHMHKEKLPHGKNKIVSEDDLDELRACFELGFGFDQSCNSQLSDTFPALELYHAVNKQYNKNLSRSSSVASSDCNVECPSTTSSIVDLGDEPEKVKTKLKQWAQVVACSARHSSSLG